MKEPVKAGIATVAGAAVGTGTYSVIGGIEVAATGTAIGVTLGPFIGIGASVGLGGYCLYWLGKQVGQKKSKNDK